MDCPQHLYIHWPFCKNKCHYCDFVAFEKHEAFILDYHLALCEEITRFAQTLSPSASRSIKTIFFGGGTPSLYPLDLLEELFELLNHHFSLEEAEEISLEVNPGGIGKEHLERWSACKINRLSIGVQVLNDEVLAKLNRFQTTADVLELLKLAPSLIPNISADLIMGLPDITRECWETTLNTLIAFPLKHISTYVLMVHEKTPFFFKIKKGEIHLPAEHELIDRYQATHDFLQNHGFEQYETSNFAKKGYHSVHNTAYWERRPYRGFGLGAASFDGKERTTNLKNLKTYLEAYSKADHNGQALHYSFKESLNADQERMEIVMLGLRQRKGIELQRMLDLTTPSQQTAFFSQLSLLKEHSLIEEKDGMIALTPKGMILENEIIVSLL